MCSFCGRIDADTPGHPHIAAPLVALLDSTAAQQMRRPGQPVPSNTDTKIRYMILNDGRIIRDIDVADAQ